MKLNILASDTKGGIFYIHEKKELMDIIKKLIKSKQLVSTFQDEPIKIKIKKEDYDFYSHLAKDLLEAPLDRPAEKCVLCQDEICPVCTDIKDIPRICPSCRSHFHNCCITNHTLQHNIGIPHIFRCPECDILLKINQDEIVFIDDSPHVKVEDYIQHQLTENISHADFSVPEPPLQIDQDNMGVISEDKKRTQTVSKTVRIGGFFGKAYSVKKEGDQVIYEKLTGNPKKSTEDDQPEELKVITDKLEENQQITEKYWKPLSKTSEEDGKPRVLICPACGSPINEKKPPLHCPYCGSNMN